MAETVRQEACASCPFEEFRVTKVERLLNAINHYDYCRTELFGGQPVLSDTEEEMVRGIMTQQATLRVDGRPGPHFVGLVGSIAQSGGDNTDFLARAVSWIGLENQRQQIDTLQQEVEQLSCGVDCLDLQLKAD